MAKKKTNHKGKSTANRMNHDQSMRFINALFCYSKEHDISMADAAAMCEVPLSQINIWSNPAVPFDGRIDKGVMRRFCAAAGIGRDDLMRLATKDPIVRKISTDDLDAMPEYAYRQYVDDNGDDPDDDEKPTAAAIAADDAAEAETKPEPVEQDDTQSPAEPNTSPDALSPFERAIVALMREHDAATAGASSDTKDLTSEIERLTQQCEELMRTVELRDEALAHGDAAIKNYGDNIDKLTKAIKRKDNEIARLQGIVEKTNLAAACSAGYTRYIEDDALFTKRNLTPQDVYTIASMLWNDRLFFTKAAQRDLRTYHGDAYELLGALRALAVPINNSLHKDEALDANALRTVGGFEIALHESERTTNDKKCRQERTVAYNGRQVYFEKHLKAGHGSDSLRIYFEFDREARCIVIGRCGNHLSTVRGF